MSQLRAFAWDTRPGTKGLSLCPIGARAAERPPVAAFQIGDAPSALSYRCRAVARRYEILLRASMRLRRCRSSRPRFVGLSESAAKAAPEARHCFKGLAPRAQAAMGLVPTQRGRSICSALDSPHLQGLSQPAEPRRAHCAPASSFLSMAFSCKPRSYAAFSSRDMAFS